jgi:hypothetical protein
MSRPLDAEPRRFYAAPAQELLINCSNDCSDFYANWVEPHCVNTAPVRMPHVQWAAKVLRAASEK